MVSLDEINLDTLARKLKAEYPYGHEAFGMLSTIKMILWVLTVTNVLKLK